MLDLQLKPTRRTIAVAALLACAWLLGAGPARADFGSPRTISSPATDAERPTLAFGADGTAVAAWQSRPAGSHTGPAAVEMRQVGPNGGLGPIEELAVSADEFPSPQVAIDPEGGGVIAWFNDGVKAARIGPDGAVGPTRRLLAALPGDDQLTDLKVAVGRNGMATVVWVHYLMPGRRLEAARIGPGSEVDPARVVTGNGRVENPDVAVDRRDSSTIVWQTRVGVRQLIRAARLSASGSVRPLGRLSRNRRRSRRPDVALHDSGAATVVWERIARRDAIQAAWISRGGAVSGVRNLARAKRTRFDDPAVTIDGRGRGRVVWEQHRRAAPRIKGATLHGRAKLRRRYAVATTNGFEAPQIVVDAEGIATTIWGDHIGGDFPILGAALDARGRRSESETVVDSSERAELAIDTRGRPGVVSERRQDGRSSIELALGDGPQARP